MTADALSKKIIASVLQDSEVIRIEADDASQAKALAIVSDVAKEYLQNAGTNANARAEAQLSRQINGLNTSIADLTNNLAAAQQRRQNSATPNTPSAEETQFQTSLNNANSQLQTDQSQLSQLSLNDVTTPKLKQLTQPYEAGKVAPKPVRTGIAGILAGMMIAAGVVVLLLRRRLRNLPADQFG
jgi:capsular polysaccharide biosynthesis protein